MRVEDFKREDLINEILKYQGLLAKAEVDIECLEDYNDKLNNMGKRYANTIAKAIEYIKNNIADPDFMKREYGEKVIETSEVDIYVKNIKELIDILQGGDLDD